MSDFDAATLLAWQIELGADEAIQDRPVDRYALEAAPKTAPAKPTSQSAPRPAAAPAAVQAPQVDAVALARAAASAASDLQTLRAAMAGFEPCELRKGARNLVFGAGALPARVMVIADVPDRDEDREGRPFVGPVGAFFDAMFAAIDLSTDAGLYVTNVLPWRPPQDRDPTPAEMAMITPFLERHIALVDPDALVIMGNGPAAALLGKRGINRLRGNWATACGKPALPMQHPKQIQNNPEAKRMAWADLLSLKAKVLA